MGRANKSEIFTSSLVQVFLLDISEYVKNMGDWTYYVVGISIMTSVEIKF